MEHRRSKDSRKRKFQIHDDGEKAMILSTSNGEYQRFAPRYQIIGTLDDALNYLEKWPWGNVILKVDTIKASLI